MQWNHKGTYAHAALQKEILRSARLRAVLFVAVLFAAALPIALFLLGPRIAFAGADAGLTARFAEVSPLILSGLLALALTEAGIGLYLSRCLLANTQPPGSLAVIQTIVEAILPAWVLFAALRILGVVDTFGGALPWLFFPVIVLSALHLRFGLSFFSGLLSAAGFIFVAELGLTQLDAAGADGNILTIRHPYYIKAAILIATGALTGLVAIGIRRQLYAAVGSAAERDRAVSIFGQHVSPEVAHRLLHQPVADVGESRCVCVMFLDIRDFSKFAAAHPASEVMAYLNALFGELIVVVNANQGIINKFLGDGFMAVFGAPGDDVEPALNATRCALSLLDRADELSAAGIIPRTRLGIGLHIGDSVTGNVGAATRKEYTVIGDAVNLAARIEQATKTFSAQLLVSDEVWKCLPDHEFTAENLGLVELKGQPKPVVLHKLR